MFILLLEKAIAGNNNGFWVGQLLCTWLGGDGLGDYVLPLILGAGIGVKPCADVAWIHVV